MKVLLLASIIMANTSVGGVSGDIDLEKGNILKYKNTILNESDADRNVVRAFDTSLTTRATSYATFANALYSKAILKEERKQTELLEEILVELKK